MIILTYLTEETFTTKFQPSRQECFLKGEVYKNHDETHPLKEYIRQVTYPWGGGGGGGGDGGTLC